MVDVPDATVQAAVLFRGGFRSLTRTGSRFGRFEIGDSRRLAVNTLLQRRHARHLNGREL